MSLDKSPTSEMAKALSLSFRWYPVVLNDLSRSYQQRGHGYTTNRSIVEGSRLESAGLKRGIEIMRVEIPDEIYFITFPGDVSWSKDSVNSEVATYGSNAPYLTYGTTKLRNLSLGNCLFEGFSDGKAVEGNITELEAAMNMVITEFGSASPYCWNAYAGGKQYGTFIIQSVQVQEQMRDMSGNLPLERL